MRAQGVSPNYVTLVSVLPAISRLGDMRLGKWIHCHAIRNEIAVDDVLGSALVDMYSKCGDVEAAVILFESLPKKNPVTWSALIGGLALNGRAHDAINHFHMMEKEGGTPPMSCSWAF
ncbi:Pentatricopeptide repeat-containing protein [Platanthera zijinensis]|uniref:Pentatricopeptide repeat-containing protein n=1 Tax=Platanthera zijinensis TaxID=2320716 RepID=A0AAP0BD32_9ASPA